MSPSARRRPEGVIELTWTGGGYSEARKFVKADGLRISRKGKHVCKLRRFICWNNGRESGKTLGNIVNGSIFLE